MTDELNDDGLPLTDDEENEDEEVADGAELTEDVPASLLLGDDGEPLEATDDDEAILSDSFTSEEDPDAEDPDAYLYRTPTVSFSDSAEEEVLTDWPEEE